MRHRACFHLARQRARAGSILNFCTISPHRALPHKLCGLGRIAWPPLLQPARSCRRAPLRRAPLRRPAGLGRPDNKHTGRNAAPAGAEKRREWPQRRADPLTAIRSVAPQERDPRGVPPRPPRPPRLVPLPHRRAPGGGEELSCRGPAPSARLFRRQPERRREENDKT